MSNFRDFYLTDCGSLVLFSPLTQAAEDWLAKHCPADGEHSYMGASLAVEPRYLEDLLARAGEDGLSGPGAS